ncbi:hypothetical protein [Mesorhizobium kowhaii]|uniref:Uncharacterized protein n=1 Tax=Mesorhizobium kowhaii TaxID=1300272 RepID=A0A2W7BYD0_9HYPH|nr:hypothetical protein [Mesorhizobium kowhaii]PZV35865.1 hypothetical protein B5V02_24890 [Mesorhizobium kowhaii]
MPRDIWPLAFFYGGAQFVNFMEFESHYTYTAIAAAAGFHMTFIEIRNLQINLRMANRRLWFLANPGEPPADNPFQ